MKTRFLKILFLALVALSFSCRPHKLAEALANEDQQPSIRLHLEHLKEPLHLSDLYFETEAGRTLLQQKPRQTWDKEKFQAQWQMGDTLVRFLFEKREQSYHLNLEAEPNMDIVQWGFALSAGEDEYFTGLFERTVDGNQTASWAPGIEAAMNLRGQTIDMLIKPTLSLYTPFYLSSNNYGLLVNGTWPGHYDFCKSQKDKVQISFEGSVFSAQFFSAPTPAQLVQQHTLQSGPVLVPPRWAFEPWRWRDNHENFASYYDGTSVAAPFNSQLVEDILMMEALDIPCGVYWIDRPWAKGQYGYEDFEWDPQRFPRAQEMINWLTEREVRLMLWIAPWVAGEMEKSAHERGYSVPMKGPAGGIHPDSTALIDFTHPEARAWWQEQGIEKMLKQGIAGFKLDRSEELVPETRDVLFADGRTAREVRNHYPVLYAQTVYESAQKIHGDDFALLTRAGYTGSTRYTSFWGGDIGSPQEGLRAAIVALLRSSVIGFPIWGSDIGGYWQGELDREVFARWLAFGCFNPIMEVGPTEDLAPWSMKGSPSYDEELIAIWRLYAQLHSKLADYSHQHALEARATGMPIARPLFLHYPEQSETWDDWNSFFYGKDILVSAIWEKGKNIHRLYLPAGERWIDAWSKDRVVHEGGQWLEVEVPMHVIPLFLREGAEIDLGPLQELYKESLQLAAQRPNLSELEKKHF